MNDYWSNDLAQSLAKKHGKAKLVFARNVIPHVSELNSVVSGVEHMLDDNGIGIFEIHDANIIFNELHYDSVTMSICFVLLKINYYLLNKFNLFPFEIKEAYYGGHLLSIFLRETLKSKNLELAIVNENFKKMKLVPA